MAIAKIQKILIISHLSQSQPLLKAIQKFGSVHISSGDEAAVFKADKQLKAEPKRDRELEETFQKLEKVIGFLKAHRTGKPLATLLAPRAVVDEAAFVKAVSSKENQDLLHKAEKLCNKIDSVDSERAKLESTLESLRPWASMPDDLSDFSSIETVETAIGIVPLKAWQAVSELLAKPESGSVVNIISKTKTSVYCVVITLKEKYADVYKLLRANEFETVNFDAFEGSVAANIEQYQSQIDELKEQKQQFLANAQEMAKSLLELEMMYDYYYNRRLATGTYSSSAATEKTRIIEGWVKTADLPRLREVAGEFDSASICLIEPEADEQVPVDIKNTGWAKPFEVVTRLYGVPQYFEVDPTVFLAPFFAIFFALCLTDAGYGLLMIAASIYLIKKMQTGKGFMVMLLICSVLTIFAGAMTGGWFGSTLLDAAVKFNIGWLETFIVKTTWFNPLEDPMTFLAISIALGYLQIMTGLVVGFFSVLKNDGFFAAVCDKLSWLVMLNSFLVMAASKAGFISAGAGKVAVMLIYISAATILLLSHREGKIGARLGMGSYNLFSAIFYLGDLLSYLRLMALGMATGGVAMAVNIIAGIIGDVPIVGPVLAIIFLIGGHLFNVLQSLLGAFVHSMRLQFVEFFPKFMQGGGKPFEPFKEDYKYVYINQPRKDGAK